MIYCKINTESREGGLHSVQSIMLIFWARITTCNFAFSISDNRRLSAYFMTAWRPSYIMVTLQMSYVQYHLNSSSAGRFCLEHHISLLTCIWKCLYFLTGSKWNMQIRLCFFPICLMLFYKAKFFRPVVVALFALVNWLFVTFTFTVSSSVKSHGSQDCRLSSCLD